MNFREANPNDAQKISQLHAESWRQSYRGMLSDYFLDHEVVADRLAVWEQRLNRPDHEQHILLAEEAGNLHGFICNFIKYDTRWGTLLDNLHITSFQQGRGLGRELMARTADRLKVHHPLDPLHLWVFANNTGAIRFYERLGARHAGEKMEDQFGETPVRSLLYVWDKIDLLIDRI